MKPYSLSSNDNASICDKTLEELLQEMSSNGQQIDKEKIKASMQEIRFHINTIGAERSALLAGVKTASAKNDDSMLLAYIALAIEKHFSHSSRDTQLLASLMFIKKTQASGRILQIKTGEGKSDIIAITAAFFALKQRKVDIVTSGAILAQRDASRYSKFFQSLGIRCGHIIDFYKPFLRGASSDNVYLNCQVLYGTSSIFSGDMLFDIAYRKDIANRSRDLLIADEVDNMLVDNSSFLVRISGFSPGLEPLQHFRQKVWMKLQTLTFANGGKKVDDIENILYLDIVRTIRDEAVKISQYHRELAEMMLRKWIASAIYAHFDCKEDVHYIIENNRKVCIMDSTTGEQQKDTRWSSGLHAFIEMKHKLPVGEDNFTTLYYSNHRFYSSYGSNICGLTGTLGSRHTRQFLQEIYNVDMMEIPSFRKSQLIMLPPINCRSTIDWANSIVQEVSSVNLNKRPVLVICEDIAAVKTLEQSLSVIGNRLKLVLYVYSESEDLADSISTVSENTVILATNLGGRGTDIDINDAIESRGGLHAILAYYPKNQRIEEQAIGRTARKGQKGSARTILLLRNDNSIAMSIVRDLSEEFGLQSDRVQIKQYAARDQMFQQICNLYYTISDKGTEEALKERWGVFLAKMEITTNDNNSEDTAQDQANMFEEFFEKLQQDFRNGNLSQNPCHYYLNVDGMINKSIEAVTKDRNANLDEQRRAKTLLDAAAQRTGLKSEGYYLRKAILCNNLGEYDTAKDHIKDAIKIVQENVTLRQAAVQMGRGAAIVHDGNEVLQQQHEVRRNAILQEFQETTGLQVDNMSINQIRPRNNQRNDRTNDGIAANNHITTAAPNAAQSTQVPVAITERNQINGGVRNNHAASINQGTPNLVSPPNAAQSSSAQANNRTARQLPQLATAQIDLMADVEMERIQLYIDLTRERTQQIFNVVETNHQNNANDFERHYLDIDEDAEESAQESKVKTEVPPTRISKRPPPPKKTGFLGFILGGLMIIAGAALVLCSGGLLAGFGVNMIMNGIQMIEMNIQMNRDGTYDANAIIRRAVELTAQSVLQVGLPLQLQAFGPVLQRAGNLFGMLGSPETVGRVVNESVRATDESGDSASAVGQVVDEETAAIRDMSQSGTPEQKTSFVNDNVRSWYDNSLKGQLEAISPARLDAFAEHIDPIVDRTLTAIKSRLMVDNSFKAKMLTIASCLMSELKDQLTFERSVEHEKRLFNPKSRVRLDTVIGCTEAQIGQVRGIDVPSNVMERLLNYVEHVYNQVYPRITFYLLQSTSERIANQRDILNRDIEVFNQSAATTQAQKQLLEKRGDQILEYTNSLNALIEDLKDTAVKKEVAQLISNNVVQLQSASRSIEQILRPSTIPAQSKNVITRVVTDQLAVNGSWRVLMNEKTPITVDMICELLRPTIEQEIYAKLSEIKKSAS